MESQIRLSILIPSVPERLDKLDEVMNKYHFFIDQYGLTDIVEIISLCDNKKRSIGKKRFDLVQMAQGTFVVWSDDDDLLTEKYFQNIKEFTEGDDVEVVTYKQFARIDHNYSFIYFGLKSENEDLNPSGITKRKAWHCCTWRKSVIDKIPFGDKNWGEDSVWADQANLYANNEQHINEICHIYTHDSELTTAFQ